MTPTTEAMAPALTLHAKQLLDFLVRTGSAKRKHSGDTLLHHLWGTYALLKREGADRDVCAAGLFHSVYGTSLYRAPPLVGRDTVRLQIGERAERLAWLFSVLRRPRCWGVAGTALPLARGGVIEVMPDDLRDLRLIERANKLEKIVRRRRRLEPAAARTGGPSKPVTELR